MVRIFIKSFAILNGGRDDFLLVIERYNRAIQSGIKADSNVAVSCEVERSEGTFFPAPTSQDDISCDGQLA